MSSDTKPKLNKAFSTLREFARNRESSKREKAKELCDFCSIELPTEHDHLIEPPTQQIVCSCTACALLFSEHGETELKYYRIPRRKPRILSNFRLSDEEWDSLMIPVGMAFFFYNSAEEKTMVFYPGPAGATESLLTLESWEEIVENNPVLKEMTPDVEALLVNRVDGAREHYIVTIDKCYELVGIIRTRWHGLSGGKEAWEGIRKFFDNLREMSVTNAHGFLQAKEGSHA